jgi:arylsulfatase A-like enzyme
VAPHPRRPPRHTDGEPLPTNTADGDVLAGNVTRYLDADPLAPFGFSGWVGPEPHGGLFANSGLVRDPLIAERVVAWLTDRYERRRAGDVGSAAAVPAGRQLRQSPRHRAVPAVDAPGHAARGRRRRGADGAVAAHRLRGPAHQTRRPGGVPGGVPVVLRPARPGRGHSYNKNHQRYRDLYHQLHATVDGPLDRVRRAVTDGTTGEALIVRTSDHGELLGAHGGLHQKWFQLYDEATRVPFAVAHLDASGAPAGEGRRIGAPTSHVDLVPTLLAAAGIDEAAVAEELRADFTRSTRCRAGTCCPSSTARSHPTTTTSPAAPST